jgi:hypothetical protein
MSMAVFMNKSLFAYIENMIKKIGYLVKRKESFVMIMVVIFTFVVFVATLYKAPILEPV